MKQDRRALGTFDDFPQAIFIAHQISAHQYSSTQTAEVVNRTMRAHGHARPCRHAPSTGEESGLGVRPASCRPHCSMTRCSPGCSVDAKARSKSCKMRLACRHMQCPSPLSDSVPAHPSLPRKHGRETLTRICVAAAPSRPRARGTCARAALSAIAAGMTTGGMRQSKLATQNTIMHHTDFNYAF